MNTDDIDRFGHCVICHKNLIYKRIVDGKEMELFMPIHDHTDFMLNSGSIMKVCMCKPCKESTDLHDPLVHDSIMQAVQKGWELETKLLVENKTWEKDHGEKYLKEMAKLNIALHADNIEKRTLETKSKELSESFREKNK